MTPRVDDPTPPIPSDAVVRRARFRTNLVRVLAIQLVTLILLWLLQARYTG